MWNWTNHGFSLYRNRDFLLAEQCVNIAFYFRSFGVERTTTILCRGLIRYELNKESGAQRDIDEVKIMDPILAEVGKPNIYVLGGLNYSFESLDRNSVSYCGDDTTLVSWCESGPTARGIRSFISYCLE